jgi:hypothetical protein
MLFRSTASTALRNPLLTLTSRRPFERVFFYRRTTLQTRPSPCADLTECKRDAIHRGILLYTVINVCDCTLSCLPLRLPHAVHLPAVLQLGAAQCPDLTPQPTPDISRQTIKWRYRKLLETSSLTTVRFFFSIDRSIQLSIESFNVAPHKMSATSVAFFDSQNLHFRSTALLN